MRRIYNLCLSIAAAALLAACSSDKEPDPPVPITEDNPVYMSFSVTVENTDPSSRAGDNLLTRATYPDPSSDENAHWGNEDRVGNSFETTLLGDNFTPVLVVDKSTDSDNPNFETAGQFKILSYWTSSEGNLTTYFIHGSFEPTDEYDTVEKLKQVNVKLMVVANTESDPMDYIANLGNLTYSHDLPTIEDNRSADLEEGFKAIPMWGVSEVDLSQLKQGSYTLINDKTPCQLLRAMAKVEISLNLKSSQRGRDVHITSVEINRYNNAGYVLPGKWNSLANTTDLKYSETMRTEKPEWSVKYSQTDEDGRSINPFTTTHIRQRTEKYEGETTITHPDMVCFYLPEMTNSSVKEDCIQIRVNYTVDGIEKSNHLYFTPYADGGPKSDGNGGYLWGEWNVVRNHIYEYKITGVQDSKISIDARVKEWKYHKNHTDLE